MTDISVCDSFIRTKKETAAADEEVGRVLRSSTAAQRLRTSLSPLRSRPSSVMSRTSDKDSKWSMVIPKTREPSLPMTIQGSEEDAGDSAPADMSDSSVMDLTGPDTDGSATRKRKRGRPRLNLNPDGEPNVGGGCLAVGYRREEVKLQRPEKEERRREEAITDPAVKPSHLIKSRRLEQARV